MRRPAPVARALAALAALVLPAGCGGPEVPRDRVTVVGSANFLPGPEQPYVPSLAEALLDAAGVADRVARATGNGEGMQLLCRMPDALARLAEAGGPDLREPDIVLMTRAPVPAELEICRRNGVEPRRLRLAAYLGGIPGADRSVDGIWMVWDAAQEARSRVTARVVATARAEAVRLVDGSAYGRFFRAEAAGS